MTANDPRPSGFDGNARGLMVLVVALVVGFLLLLNGGDGDDAATVADTSPSTIPLDGVEAPDGTTEVEDTTTTTEAAAATRQPSEVQVIVLNGSGVTGAAAVTAGTIGQGGWNMLPEGNGPPTEATTVYFDEDYEAEATAIALLLGKTPDVVEPLASASLGGAESTANVVVVLGADTPPVGDTAN